MKNVTLSFDNGPHPKVTPAVLEILAEYKIRATFFVVGKKIASEAGRALMEATHAQGHWIGNHTYNHSVPLGRIANGADAIYEIERTQELIGASSHTSRMFRPYGEGGLLDHRLLGSHSVEYLISQRFTCVIWSAVPRDWIDVDSWVDTALNQIEAQDDALMVLHDINTGAMSHLREFIERSLDAETRFRQEIPEKCLLIKDGAVRDTLHQYMTM